MVGKNYRCAEYSVVKDPLAGTAGNLFTSAYRLELPLSQRSQPEPTSAGEGPNGLIAAPKIFCQRARFRFQLRRDGACLAIAAFLAAKAGGEYRARTGDLLVANQALSQLS